jgi:hypothetical protein
MSPLPILILSFPFSHHLFPLFHLNLPPYVVLHGQLSIIGTLFNTGPTNAVPGIITNFPFTLY